MGSWFASRTSEPEGGAGGRDAGRAPLPHLGPGRGVPGGGNGGSPHHQPPRRRRDQHRRPAGGAPGVGRSARRIGRPEAGARGGAQPRGRLGGAGERRLDRRKGAAGRRSLRLSTGGAWGGPRWTARPTACSAAVDRLSLALLRDVWRSKEPLPNLRLASLTTDSIDALRSYLEGERYYRRTEWDSALSAYTRAVETDSTFALAHLRRAQVIGWTGGYGNQGVQRGGRRRCPIRRSPARARPAAAGGPIGCSTRGSRPRSTHCEPS